MNFEFGLVRFYETYEVIFYDAAVVKDHDGSGLCLRWFAPVLSNLLGGTHVMQSFIGLVHLTYSILHVAHMHF